MRGKTGKWNEEVNERSHIVRGRRTAHEHEVVTQSKLTRRGFFFLSVVFSLTTRVPSTATVSSMYLQATTVTNPQV